MLENGPLVVLSICDLTYGKGETSLITMIGRNNPNMPKEGTRSNQSAPLISPFYISPSNFVIELALMESTMSM